MKKLKCFLCGARYSPENRDVAAVLYQPNDDEQFLVSYIRVGGRTLRLCPACVKAAALGMVMTGIGYDNTAQWGGEEIEYEED